MSRVYFTDRNLGKQFAAILAAAGLRVERHHDLFPPDGTDEQWLAYCGTNGRVAVTHDRRIRHKINERDAVIRFKVSLLVVIGHVPYPELARSFVANLSRIEAFVAQNKAPYIAKVYRPSPAELSRNPFALGEVTLWYPK